MIKSFIYKKCFLHFALRQQSRASYSRNLVFENNPCQKWSEFVEGNAQRVTRIISEYVFPKKYFYRWGRRRLGGGVAARAVPDASHSAHAAFTAHAQHS